MAKSIFFFLFSYFLTKICKQNRYLCNYDLIITSIDQMNVIKSSFKTIHACIVMPHVISQVCRFFYENNKKMGLVEATGKFVPLIKVCQRNLNHLFFLSISLEIYEWDLGELREIRRTVGAVHITLWPTENSHRN